MKGFLDPSILKDEPNLSPIGSGNWPFSAELYVSPLGVLTVVRMLRDVYAQDHAEYPTFEGKHAYRDNCFRSTSRLIGGLTSSILVSRYLDFCRYSRVECFNT